MVVRLLLNEVGCHRCWAAVIVALPFFFFCWWPTLLGGVAIGAQAVVFSPLLFILPPFFGLPLLLGLLLLLGCCH